MSHRFLIALAGLVGVVVPLTLYLLRYRYQKQKLIRNLLSLSKGRRFFWYLLRKDGFQIKKMDVQRTFTLEVDGQPKQYQLKLDFLLAKGREVYGGIFATGSEERDLMKSFFIFVYLYRLDGVVFYREEERSYAIWKL